MDRPGDDAEHDRDRDPLESGPFTLKSEGVMQSCKPRRWIVKEVCDSVCEMLVMFEPEYGELEPTPGAPAGSSRDKTTGEPLGGGGG